MKLNRFWAVFAAILLVSASAFAQTTSNLTGRVTMDGNPLPGVTVTISSPNLQGTRTAVTDVNGNYNFSALPPGEYTARFEMESMQTATRTARLGLGQTGRADAEMRLTAVAEAITVTASAPAVLETTEVQTNVTAQLVDDLPIPRNFQAQANLAPNVTTNSPSGAQLVISGAPAHENLYMVNGAVINENLRGQIHNLFIEDAIQETTVLTGAISAEYGRFTGGVVNSITKSGGNEFTGSFRDSFTNPSWTDKTPFPGEPDATDVLNEVYEATLGGRIIRDRLWFFGAGRYTEQSRDAFLFGTNNKYVFNQENTRLEGKLTGQITPKHSVAVSYLDIEAPEGPYCFIACYEFSNIDPQRTLPNSFMTAHYAGIFTSNLLGEINYSEKKFAFEGSGGPATDDPALGSWGYDLNTGAFFGAPVFCEDCGAEERNNDYLDAKITYYLASRSLGTHNITGGYQDWAEQRIANNYQSGSNFSIYTYSEQTPAENGNFMPVLEGGESFATFINWTPIFTLTEGSNFATKSFYVNDKWDFNNNFQFNLGVRFDKNDGKDAGGGTTADDSTISPRLGMIYDIFGNGRLRLNASYGQYVAKIAETVGGGGSGAGNPAYVWYAYMGPDISGVPTTEAFRRVFNWFNDQGGTEATDLIVFAQFPGVSTRIAEGVTLKSPNVQELTLGAGTQLGRGYARLDFISRDWADFYASRTTPNVHVSDPLGQESDLIEIFTTNDNLERTYRGASLQASYPITERFQLGGNYTWSETKGNVTAETGGNGPVTESIFRYPEFKSFAANNPTGFLPSDETHKVRAWVTYTLPTPVGNFTFSALERFDSGTPFSALGTVDTRPFVSSAVRATYLGDPTGVNYYFGERGGFRWDDQNALDVTINYRLRLGRVELFVQPELINAFNEDAVLLGDTTVLTAKNTTTLQAFNPFTETPVEGTHYRFGSNFGKPRNALDYQLPRTYRVSAGIRF